MGSNAEMTYSIEFVNNSSNPGAAALFQTPENAYGLVWLSKYAYPMTTVTFDWQQIYDFVWSETGQLVPGVIFSASEVIPADLTTQNAITLNYDTANDAYYFSGQTAGPTAGSLYIAEVSSIPLDIASVGIGMSGSPTRVVQAQPNMNVTFTPKPEYWIAFGDYQQGEVMSSDVSNAAQVTFPPNIYAMRATLNIDNTWTITPIA